MSYGFIMSPIQLRWFRFLSSTFPMTKTSTWLPALKRVAFDQFLFAPAGLCCFFTFMTIAEGGGKRAVQRKFQEVYVPALKANFMVWPTVQIINFRVMPIQYQIVSCLDRGRATLYLHFISPLSQQSVLPGRPISPLQTRLRKRRVASSKQFYSISRNFHRGAMAWAFWCCLCFFFCADLSCISGDAPGV